MSQVKAITIQRKWLFLTYNDSEKRITGPALLLNELVEKLKQWSPYYGVAGKEEAPTTGMCHYHVVICCKNQVRSKKGEVLEIKGINPHLERINNNLKAVIKYCMKEENYAEFNKDSCPVTFDEVKKQEKAKLMMTGDLEDLFMKGTLSSIDCLRADKLRRMFQVYRKPEAYRKKLVMWFKGETGEGKTRKAVELAEEFGKDWWISNGDLKWFDGYNNQKVAILDEFRKQMMPDWNYLLRVLDGYHMLVPVKGSFVQWNPEIIIITSPATPTEAFSWINKDGEVVEWDHQEQLTRRLTYKEEYQVYEFPLWDDERLRLERTIRDFLGIQEDQVEEELSLSPILPEPTQDDEA